MEKDETVKIDAHKVIKRLKEVIVYENTPLPVMTFADLLLSEILHGAFDVDPE